MVNLREAIQDKLEELEDYYQALQSLERVQTGKSPVWTQKEIEDQRDIEKVLIKTTDYE